MRTKHSGCTLNKKLKIKYKIDRKFSNLDILSISSQTNGFPIQIYSILYKNKNTVLKNSLKNLRSYLFSLSRFPERKLSYQYPEQSKDYSHLILLDENILQF